MTRWSSPPMPSRVLAASPTASARWSPAWVMATMPSRSMSASSWGRNSAIGDGESRPVIHRYDGPGCDPREDPPGWLRARCADRTLGEDGGPGGRTTRDRATWRSVVPIPGEEEEHSMALIVTTVPILGPAEAVFDLVTTARFWPDWQPATLAVGGVTERPFGPGD